ncbi:MAG: hypothetical protein WC455_13545 [Dehalococcoidia bacterium]|jgi:hypothetical protein
MGTYHEYRAPQGEPATGEHDVWLENGEVVWGHWDGSAWVVDATADSAALPGPTGDKGATGDKGPTGDEGPPCPTGGNADTLDGLHANEISANVDSPAYIVIPYTSGCPSLGSGWSTDWLVLKRWGDVVFLNGEVTWTTGASSVLLTLPSGYRPGYYSMFFPTNFSGAQFFTTQDGQIHVVGSPTNGCSLTVNIMFLLGSHT